MGNVEADGSILEASSLFAGFDRRALDNLARYARRVALDPGQTLFRQGDAADGCYAILDGVLKVSIVGPEGEEALLAMFGMGEMIGEMALIDGEPRSATVTALKPCALAFLAKRDFTAFAEAHPAIYRHMLTMMIGRLRKANEAFTGHLLLPAGGRLARVLVRLAEVFGQPLDDGRLLIRQKVTQVDLARMTASARENVNRQLTDWRKSGLVSRIGDYYCVEDIARLRESARL